MKGMGTQKEIDEIIRRDSGFKHRGPTPILANKVFEYLIETGAHCTLTADYVVDKRSED